MRTDEDWMGEVMAEADRAAHTGEVPLVSIVVANAQEITRGYGRMDTSSGGVMHPEMLALLSARPILSETLLPWVLYTTVEPCPICLGAWAEVGLDRVVFAVSDAASGGVNALAQMSQIGHRGPEITVEVLRGRAVNILSRFVESNPKHRSIDYFRQLLGTSSG